MCKRPAQIVEPVQIVEQKTDMITNIFQGINIRQRANGYICATDMCKTGGKKWAHYMENKEAKEFLKELSTSVGIPTDQILQTNMKGGNYTRGTWVHPKLAIHLAQWISPMFVVKANEWLYRFLIDDPTLIDEVDRLVHNQTMDIMTQNENESKLFNMVRLRMANIPNTWTEEQTERMLNMLVMSFKADMSDEPFPINLKDIAVMLNVNKADLKRLMLSKHKSGKNRFEEKTDYLLSTSAEKVNNRPEELVMLTVECSKNLCMLSKSEAGDDIRKYFIMIEQLIKECLRDPTLLAPIQAAVECIEPGVLAQQRIDCSVNNRTALVKYKGRLVVYIIDLHDYPGFYKYGQTKDIITRMKRNTKTFGSYEIIKIIPLDGVPKNMFDDIEDSIGFICADMGILQPFKPNGAKKNEVETFKPNDITTLGMVIESFQKCANEITESLQINNTDISKEDHEYRLKLLDHTLEMKKLEVRMVELKMGNNDVEPGEPDPLMEQEGQLNHKEIHKEWIISNPIHKGEFARDYYNRLKKEVKHPLSEKYHTPILKDLGYVRDRSNGKRRMWVKR